MIDPVDDALIDRYVAGECSPEEADLVRRWIAADATRQSRIIRAQALRDAARSLNDQWDVDRAWADARVVIRSAGATDQSADVDPGRGGRGPTSGARVRLGSPDRGRRLPLRRTSQLAAAACVTIGVLALAWRETSVWRRSLSLGRPESIATAARQRVTVQLRDGSRVVLAPESRLVEPAKFGVTTREVELEGAAFFDVVHDPSRPFVVNTRDLQIRDLGTRFAVDVYHMHSTPREAGASTTATRVAVTAGSVEMKAVSPGRVLPTGASGRAIALPAPMVVHAGNVGRMDALGHLTVDAASDINQYVSWTTGDLTFADVPLREAIARLERWYGVRIELDDPGLACRHITATFHDESLAQVLDQLSLVLHASHRDSAGFITLEPRDAGVSRPQQRGQAPVAAGECTAHGRAD